MNGEEVTIKAGIFKYDVDFKSYYEAGNVFTDCNSILFINYGTATVTINSSIVLLQNQSWGVEGNAGEVTHKVFQIAFAAGATNNLVVARKNYIK